MGTSFTTCRTNWESWDRQLKQACSRVPGKVDQSDAFINRWDDYVALRHLAYHLRDQLRFSCVKLSEARKDIADLQADASVMLQQSTYTFGAFGRVPPVM